MTGRGTAARIVLGLMLLGMVVAGCRSPTPGAVSTPSPAPTATTSPTSPPASSGEGPAPTPAPQSTPDVAQEGETMTLTIVFDNNPYDPRLQTGWGFAAWLEYEGQTVLFDTGADGAVLLDNMGKLGLDPRAIDLVVLSHIHGDHTGGLAHLLAVNAQVAVYLPRSFPARLKEEVRGAGAAVVEVDAPQEIVPGLWSTGQMGAEIVEQALIARTAQGLIVVSGCAHPGIDRMVARAVEVGGGEVRLVLGGFHLGGASRGRVNEIIAEFRRLGVRQVAPCHCTGDDARKLFREAYGQDFFAAGVGWHWQSEAVAWKP